MNPCALRKWLEAVRRYGLQGVPHIVAPALFQLRKLDSTAYRVLCHEGGSAFIRRLSLKMKTKALIRHDRILRGEV